MQEEKLNTMDSFQNEGFKIERDGKVFTLNANEMCHFRDLNRALYGRCVLDSFKDSEKVQNDKDLLNFVDMSQNEEQICVNLGQAIEDAINSDVGETELSIAESMIMDEYKIELSVVKSMADWI